MATDVSRPPVAAASTTTTTTATAAVAAERHHKGRKPFSSLMKRLASLKNHSSPTPARTASCPTASPYSPYYPYKAEKPTDGSPPSSSSAVSAVAPSHVSSATGTNTGYHGSANSFSSAASSPTATPSQKSRRRPTAPSAATTATASTFSSSPTPSVRSLTTTLTTIQSTAPGSILDPYPHYNPHPSHHHNPNAPPMLFQHQFPNAPTPSPTPLTASTLHPLNYSTATAGGLLTDNASIITLASSSKHRRRHSLDTDASVRALAPSSLWGGSRESLPLSVLSSNFERATAARRSVADDDASMGGGDGDGQSMRDGSSNVGVWHGVFGSREREAKRERLA